MLPLVFSIEKIMEIDTHIAVAMSGLTADANTLIDHARVESQYHRFTYAEPMDVESLTQSVCDFSMRFGEGGDDGDDKPKMVRTPPFVPSAYLLASFLCLLFLTSPVPPVRCFIPGGWLRPEGPPAVRGFLSPLVPTFSSVVVFCQISHGSVWYHDAVCGTRDRQRC
jgi:Proteasome subunit